MTAHASDGPVVSFSSVFHLRRIDGLVFLVGSSGGTDDHPELQDVAQNTFSSRDGFYRRKTTSDY